MSTETWTNVVIGSGEGGKYLAWHLASLGQKTAVVERRWVGGSCPNTNCLPAKNEIWSAKVAHLTGEAADFGVSIGPISIDMGGVRRRKRAMVDGLVAMHLEKYKSTGAELIMGSAHFLDSRTIEVSLNSGGKRTIVADRFFLNLGTHAAIPAIAGLRESSPLTHIEVLELDRLPAHLAVIGGGYVGLEFAQAYRRFGSRVTILQRGPQLLENQDADVAAEVSRFLSAEGIEIVDSADLIEVTGRSGSEVTIRFRTQKGERTLSASDILVAAGRTPNTNDAGLEAAGVQVDSRGYVVVNDKLETTAPNIRAIGECAGSPQFTHASFDDFRVIRENLAGNYRSTRGRLMPSCLFMSRPGEKFLIQPSRNARDGKMTQREAAERMGVTERWVRKLLRRMKKQGDAVVVHRLRGRASNRKLPAKTQKQALAILRKPEWHDFGPTFAG